MAEWKKKLPIGIDNFKKIVGQGFYYVDKTGLIVDLLHNWGEVNLFTRPRRFGKSLNISMLQTFFEIGCEPHLFDGLNISCETDLCEKYMGKFPVISISLKDVSGCNFNEACSALRAVIWNEAIRFSFLQESPLLSDEEKDWYRQLIRVTETNGNLYAMSEDTLPLSLKTLSFLLSKHYGKEVILLIDEYDVPLDKAFDAGYYNEMVSLIRNLLGSALKTNPNLHFAVLTGCLRISKESIFTGLNNFNVFSTTDVRFDEYFGFTDEEVKEMLSYYEITHIYPTVKEWYDGYQFGNVGVYCPWDVIKYCYALLADPSAFPEDYWSNTSSNNIVRHFIEKADLKTKDEIERLIAGETIVKEIHQDLTYNELYRSIENLWSILFTTGYLTQCGREGRKKYRLRIPNAEIRELFVEQIREWFQETSRQNPTKLDTFCQAFLQKNPETIESLFQGYLWNTISIRDTATANSRKENFYHGILLGLLSHKENWLVLSNAESGEGYSDILIEAPEDNIGIVIEVKYAENNSQLEAKCKEALRQTQEKQYASRLISDGMQHIIVYGIACFKKRCKVMSD